MRRDWTTLTALLAGTPADVPDQQAALLDVVRWVAELPPLLGQPPHNQYWQLARHRGLIVNEAAGHALTGAGRALLAAN